MSKEDILEILMILSAVESWSFADKHRMPDYLLERLNEIVEKLVKEVMK